MIRVTASSSFLRWNREYAMPLLHEWPLNAPSWVTWRVDLKARTIRLIRSNGKCVGNEAGLFAFVAGECTDGGAGAGFTSGVGDFGAEERA